VNGYALVSAMVMGALGSVHCVAMCGGVVGVLCAGTPAAVRASPLRQLPYALGYNAGRILSYAAAGLVAGGAGALAGGAVPVHPAQFALRVVAGAMMLGVGLYLAGALRAFGALEKLGGPLWRRVQPLARRVLPVRSAAGALTLGLLWGWLPCGLVYGALVLALASGSASDGALTMVAFGAGTLPTLLAMSALASGLGRFSRRVVVRRAAGFLIAALGVFSIVTAVGPMTAMLPGHAATARHCH
jgi:sulfite exporter TauE/SafE